VGIYGDPDGDEDLGYARTPVVTRKHGEHYEAFVNRLQPNAQFIAHARTDLPRALAAIEAADHVASRFEELLAQVHRCEGYCPLCGALAAYRKERR
jgi:hypothetical protein